MPDLPTRTDLFNIGADDILSRSAARPVGQRLSAEEVFTEGSDINIVTASSSAMAEEVERQLAEGVKILLLDGATGIDLDRLVADRFSPTVVRKQATPAVATVKFSRFAGAMPAGILPVGTRVRTPSGLEFKTTAVATFSLGQVGPVSAPAQAVDAGLSGNVAPGAISQFSTPPFDTNLVVFNDQPASGGDDIETDARLRERARDFFRTARRGTLQAIEFGALTVAGVRLATAVEEVDSMGDPTGRVSLYISDAQGNGNAQLVAAVRSALREYRGAGVIVDVVAATPAFVPIQFNLRFEAGVDTTAAFNSVRLAVVAAVNALAPQQTLPVSLLIATARSVPGVIVLDDAVVAPVGDLVPGPGEVIRTTEDLVTAV